MRSLLVIDDKVATRGGVYHRLASRYALEFTATARESRALIRRGIADLVILDAQLPDVPGVAFLREIAVAHPTMPVIVFARHGSERLCLTAFRSGARDYFSEPIDIDMLMHSIENLTGDSRQTTAPSGALGIPMGPDSTRVDPRLDHAMRYIMEHYDEPLTLEMVGRAVGLGRFTLSHRFSHLARMSFRTFLVQRRVRRAKELLEASDHSMFMVAERAGFGDISRFNKLFRKYVGVTPSAYRRAVTSRGRARTA